MQNLTDEQQHKIQTFRELSAAFNQIVSDEEAANMEEAQETMNSLATTEDEMEEAAKQLTESDYCYAQARLKMKEACMWAVRGVSREDGAF